MLLNLIHCREGCSPETNHDIDASTTVTTNGVYHNTAIPPHGGSNKGVSKKGGKNVGVPGVLSKTVPLQSPDFVPHVARIHKLIETRVRIIQFLAYNELFIIYLRWLKLYFQYLRMYIFLMQSYLYSKKKKGNFISSLT